MRRPFISTASLVAGLAFSAVAITACGFPWRPPSLGSILLRGYDSNGERIYFTATSDRGTRIRSAGEPFFGGMMTGRLSCASCHGADGRGGTHWMHMQVMEAPDIRWVTLSSGEHGAEAGHSGEGGEQAYDEDGFRRAVREGVTPGGGRLSGEMPRWEMTDEDVDDLVAFLKSLP